MIEKIYQINPNLSLDYENVLLVDDTIRTGATINTITKIFKKQGVWNVSGFAWHKVIESYII